MSAKPTISETCAMLRRLAEMNRTHEGVTFEYGNRIIDAVQEHGEALGAHDYLVAALKAAEKYIGAGYQPPELVEQISSALAKVEAQP